MVRVHLPGVQQANQAQLNIESQTLSVSVPGRYHLSLPLPYKVAETDGTATFNAAKQQLEVTLPVVSPSQPCTDSHPGSSQPVGQPQPSETRDTRQPGSTSKGKDQLSSESGRRDVTDEAHPTEPAQQDDAALDEASGSSSNNSSSTRQQGVPGVADSWGPPSNGQAHQLTENQRKWLELHPVASSSAPAAAVDPPATPAAEPISHASLLAAAAAGMFDAHGNQNGTRWHCCHTAA